MEDGMTLEWRGVRMHRKRRMASLWVMRGGEFVRSIFGYLAPGETEGAARERMSRFAAHTIVEDGLVAR